MMICKLWRKKIAAQKTLDRFKTDCTRTHQDLQECQYKSKTVKYQANGVVETEERETKIKNDALDKIYNLTNATKGDRLTIPIFTAKNTIISKQLINKNSKLLVNLE